MRRFRELKKVQKLSFIYYRLEMFQIFQYRFREIREKRLKNESLQRVRLFTSLNTANFIHYLYF